MRRAALIAAVMLFAPGRALAHPLIDEGRQHLERAEFERALAALEQAEAADDLLRSDVVDLLELRALAHLALADARSLGETLRALASIEPAHEFPPEAPPELAGMLAEQAASAPPLSLDATATPTETGIRIDAAAANDGAGLVRSVRVLVRSDGEAWRPVRAGSLVPTASVLYYAEAIGPGGAVLLRAGSPAAPLSWEPPEDGARHGDAGGGSAWPWVGVVAGVVVVGAVIAVLLLAAGDGGTQPDAPIVVGF